jgi:hypothetical protein
MNTTTLEGALDEGVRRAQRGQENASRRSAPASRSTGRSGTRQP